MARAVQMLRSILFIAQMYVVMVVMGLFFAVPMLIDRSWAFRGIHVYCRWVRWTAGWMVGLRSEIRGKVPVGEVLVASKHQSFFDIIMIVSVLPRPKFVMKRQLLFAPVLGWYARRINCIAVDRGKRGAAIKKMVADMESGRTDPGQLVIYPQGTRVAPGVQKSYKIGTAVLYTQMGKACVPAATNVGVFWPRHGIYRKPGVAVVEFLSPIAPGLTEKAFLQKLERVIEDRSDALMAEAGFHRPSIDQST